MSFQNHETHVAFVAGATGYTGSNLVPQLLRRGWVVYAHVRPDSPSLASWRTQFEALGAIVDTTPWDETAIAERLQKIQPTAVFALLGTTKKRGKSPTSAVDDTYMAVDYGLSALLLRATIHSAPNARFVYLSAYGIRPSSTNPYIQARAKLEAELRASDVNYVIVRPAIIAGEREESRPMEKVGATFIAPMIGTLRLLGAKKLAGDFRTRSGDELARNCLDAAVLAPPRSELTGHELDALKPREETNNAP